MREISDETTLLRDAIQEVLAGATAPMTSQELYESDPVRSLGVDPNRVSRELKTLYELLVKPFPLKRVPNSQGRCMWAYFNPKVVKLAYTPAEPPRPAPEQGPVNDVKSAEPEFHFNPVEFLHPSPVASATEDVAEPKVPEPTSKVKSITVSVAGVSIKIDLDFFNTGG